MQSIYKLIAIIGTGILLLILTAFYSREGKSKTGFILTQQVFQQFEGTKEVEKKFIKLQEKQKAVLDSLALTVKQMENVPSPVAALQENRRKYQQLSTDFTQANQEQYQQYTDALWKQINQYVSEYGKQEGYQFIYGGDGSGTLMYADSTLNITGEVVKYINQKYAGN